MKRAYIKRTFLLVSCLIAGCSPLKTSPHDEKHQLELTLHEVQTNLDDLRHDINCFQTEMQILDGRIRYYENTLAALKNQDLQNTQEKITQLIQQIQHLEKKVLSYEISQKTEEKNLEKLTAHANETTIAFTQFKHRLQEIEQDMVSLAKLKTNLESLTQHLNPSSEPFKTYKVSPGDSLEKIARTHKTSVEKLKSCNQLRQDLIVVGQELKIPTE
jgi:LysM repeat protein